jgi:hypothetical protein
VATQEEVEDQIGTALLAWRNANLPLMPIAWANDGFDPKTADKSLGYMRMTIEFAGGEHAALGNTHFRDFATLIIQLFTDIDDGAGRKNLVAESIKNFLRGLPQGAAGIRVIQPGVFTIGPDGVWYQQNASASIQFDSVRSP